MNIQVRTLCLMLLITVYHPCAIAQKENLVGNIEGTLNITNTGAANYSIPIETIPGTMGMEPNISIDYNSQSGLGLLGSNWQLEGLSYIRRIPQNLYIDGNITGVNFDLTDKFALDGNRLIVERGTYGANESIYKTEIETYKYVTSYGTSTIGPDYFEVVDENATVYQYGNTSDSKQMLGNAPLAWYLNKITDCEGNYITYKYSQGLGQIVVSDIYYTGNAKAGLDTYAQMIFKYDDSNVQNTAFVRGRSSMATKLLKQISTYFRGSMVKTYDFTYDYDQLPRLEKITLTGENNQKLNPISIHWGEAKNDTISSTSEVEGGNYYPINYDGDKCTDFYFCMPITKSTTYQWRIIVNDCKGTLDEELFGSIDQYSFSFPADLDGDGADEIVYAVNEAGNMLSFHYIKIDVYNFTYQEVDLNINISATALQQFMHGDLNGDRTEEILFYTPSQNPKLTIWGLNDGLIHNEIPLLTQKLMVQDNNGNGKAEIMVNNGQGTSIYEYNNLTKRFVAYVSDPNCIMGCNYDYYGDFNGDGLKDALTVTMNGTSHNSNVIINENSTNRMWSAYSTLMPLELQFNSQTNAISVAPLVGDMNGDKRDDIVVTVKQPDNKIRLDIFYSDGYLNNQLQYHKKSYIVNSFISPNYTDATRYYCSDLNGDGSSDLLYIKSDIKKIILFFHKEEQFELIQSIVDSYGSRDSLAYVMSAAPYTYYTPNFESRMYFPIVTETYSSNGLAKGMTRKSYLYLDVLYSTNRSILFGFKTIKTTNHATGSIITSKYLMNTNFDHVDLVNRDYYQGEYTLKETITPKYVNWGKRFISQTDTYEKFDYLTGVNEYTKYELYPDGRVKNALLKHSRIYNSIPLKSTQTAYQYQNVVMQNNQIANKLYITTTTESLEGSVESLKYTNTFNYLNSRLDRVVKSDNSTSNVSTLTYSDYNAIGKPKTITSSATNVNSQVEEITYDATGRFETSRKNALGQTSYSTNYEKSGNLQTTTDANGLTTSYQYDEFGREKYILYYDGTTAATTFEWIASPFFPNAVYVVKSEQTAAPTKIAFYDNLGRELFLYNDGVGYTQTVYNAKGQIVKLSRPYLLPTTLDKDKIWTTYTYTTQGRIETETGPYISTKYSYNKASTADNYEIITSDLLRNTSVTKCYKLTDKIYKAIDQGGTITYKYEYKKVNGKLSIEQTNTYNNSAIVLVYDLNNNLLTMSDPNSGTITNTYDAFNRMESKTDYGGNKTTYQYDLLNRVVVETVTGSNETTRKFEYIYDIAPGKGVGNLYAKLINGTMDEYYAYDNMARIQNRKKVIGGTIYTELFEYNSVGKLSKYTYPDNFCITYSYNALGELLGIYDNSDNTLICEISRNNFRKHATCILGNKTGIGYTYNSLGLLTNIVSGNIESNPNPIENPTTERGGVEIPYSIGNQYRNLSYIYNTKGLIERKEDSRINQYEKYVYDPLDRLTHFTTGTIAPVLAKTVTYSIGANGNITSNSRVGNYSYVNTRPNAVELINPTANCPISQATCNIGYNNLNLPSSIKEGIYTYTIEYGSDYSRRNAVWTKTENGVTSTLKTTRYVSPYFEVEITPSGTKTINYITTDQGIIAIRTKIGTQQSMYYVHTDHLGSYNLVMDVNKNIVQSCHFDPWGNRKLYNNWSEDNTLGSFMFSRGYTGHEHLDMFKIINMNARLYDPVIGLFFSPDPVIQDFENTQCLNRYSYCRNNPVMNWDLDGKIASPIFDSDGNYLGTDNKGYNGEILIFEDPSKFKQGMDHDEAKTLGKEFSKSELSIVEKSLVLNHVINGTILPYGEGKLTNKNSFIAEVENIILGNRRIEANAAYIGYANKRHMMLADFGDFEYTVENIRGEATHEIWGHGIKKYGDDNQTHWKIYAAQIDSPNWNNSTPRYKKHVALTLYLYYNNEVKNRNLPEKYLKIVREYYNK